MPCHRLVPLFVSVRAKRPTRSQEPSHKQKSRKQRSMTEQRKAVIKNADMSEDMQQEAVDCASQALSKYNIEKVSRLQRGDGQRCCCPHWPKLSMQESVEYSVEWFVGW